MKQQGRVVAVEQHKIWVDVSRQSACGSCAAKSGCGTSLIETALPSRHSIVVIKQTDHTFIIGDSVDVSMPNDKIFTASAMIYGLPLLLLLLGAAIGHNIYVTELASIVGAIVGLFIGAGFVYYIDQLLGQGLQAVIHKSPNNADMITLENV